MDSLDKLTPWWRDLKVALGTLTRLPLGPADEQEEGDLARATRTYPLAGVLIGLTGAAAFWLCDRLALPSLACGLIAVGVTALITGALHEDGLSDTADGFAGAFERERKLEIMRDSRTGVFGVLALLLSVGLRASALAEIAEPGLVALALIAAHCAARAALPVIMRQLPLARPDGLAAEVGRPEAGHAGAAAGIAAVVAWLTLGFGTGLLVLVVGGLAAGALAFIARAQIGGYTGDVLGASEQAAETAILLAVAAAL
ncbi:MAG: adenosylcobinamide-GDP ribazoletransferase [Kiloniellales bacterium]